MTLLLTYHWYSEWELTVLSVKTKVSQASLEQFDKWPLTPHIWVRKCPTNCQRRITKTISLQKDPTTMLIRYCRPCLPVSRRWYAAFWLEWPYLRLLQNLIVASKPSAPRKTVPFASWEYPLITAYSKSWRELSKLSHKAQRPNFTSRSISGLRLNI